MYIILRNSTSMKNRMQRHFQKCSLLVKRGERQSSVIVSALLTMHGSPYDSFSNLLGDDV